MSLAGSKVENYSRLRIAVSMLKDLGLHTYKFEGKCPLGYGDPKFREDINTLGVYLDYRSFEDEEKNSHRLYELNELGKSYGKEYAKKIKEKNPVVYEKLEEVANLLKDPQWTAIKLNEKAKEVFKRT